MCDFFFFFPPSAEAEDLLGVVLGVMAPSSGEAWEEHRATLSANAPLGKSVTPDMRCQQNEHKLRHSNARRQSNYPKGRNHPRALALVRHVHNRGPIVTACNFHIERMRIGAERVRFRHQHGTAAAWHQASTVLQGVLCIKLML